MKTSSPLRTLVAATGVALGLTCFQVASAQTQNPSADNTQNSKSADSTDTSNALDKNPSSASTDSADKSATKTPNTTHMDQGAGSESSMTTTMSDKEFILKAAQGGMTEVELGKLAQQNGASPEVKQFGSHMVMDHSKANTELMSIAEEKGVTVPSALDAKHQAMVERFQHLSGSAFDHAYVHAMVKDHEKDAAEFRKESTTAEDPKLKTFAGNTLEMIQSHLADIKSIQSNMK